MKVKLRGIVACFAFVTALAGMFYASQRIYAEDAITINFPTDRGIFQRNYDNVSEVSVDVSYEGEGQVKARIVDGNTAVSDWVVLDKEEAKYSGVIPDVPAGGWYQLEVSAFDASGMETAYETVEHIGVGEVFITGGQSNSCNFGGAKTSSAYDTVSAYDAAKGTWQHCEDSQPNSSRFATGNGGGSPWPTLGDELSDRLGVPIGFCSTGYGGTTMEGLCTEHYETIRQAITGLSQYGYRAFLIHQGEADTDATPMDEYSASLKKLIEMTRKDAGYDLVWIIAQVSYAWSNYNNAEKMEAIKSTQRSVCNNYDIFIGPTTDDLLGDYRYTDNLHLSEKGLIEHGKRWADVIMDKLFTKYRITADADVVHGTINQCGNSYYAGENIKLTAQAEDGYYLVPGSFKVTGNEGSIKIDNDTFKMRAEEITVTAEFAQLPEHLMALGDKIKKAELINPAEYETGGMNTLKNAVEAAKKVYANPSATEAEAAKAASDIDRALAGLVKIQTGMGNVDRPASTGPVTEPITTDIIPSLVGNVYKSGGLKYRIVTSGGENEVVVTGPVNKNKKSVTIPGTVKIGNNKYKVIGIAKKAFAKAKKLKKIVIKSTYIKSIGKNTFMGTSAKLKIKVPAKKLTAYRKLIRKSGLKKVEGIVK